MRNLRHWFVAFKVGLVVALFGLGGCGYIYYRVYYLPEYRFAEDAISKRRPSTNFLPDRTFGRKVYVHLSSPYGSGREEFQVVLGLVRDSTFDKNNVSLEQGTQLSALNVIVDSIIILSESTGLTRLLPIAYVSEGGNAIQYRSAIVGLEDQHKKVTVRFTVKLVRASGEQLDSRIVEYEFHRWVARNWLGPNP